MSADFDLEGTLARNMAGAWAQRATEAAELVEVARTAPALVKPEAVDQAFADYRHATDEQLRWLS